MDELDKIELNEETKKLLREKQSELVKIVETYAKLDKSKEWTDLNELVFSKSLEAIERQIMNEALSPEINLNMLYKLQGEWVWAKQFNDSSRFVDNVKRQLEGIKKKLQ